MATPNEVRSLLKKKKLNVDIDKFEGNWYVVNMKESPVYYAFYDSCLYFATFYNVTASRVVEDIEAIIKDCIEDERFFENKVE